MRLIFFWLLFISSLFGININESLLSIHATLVPKIPMMDYKFQEKLHNNTINIVIFYEKQDYRNARLLEEKIHAKYIKGIKEYSIQTVLKPYGTQDLPQASLYYFLPTDQENIQKIIKTTKDNSIITFSYSPEDLASGSMISLFIGTKVQPIINLHALKASKITFRPIFLKISTIYKEQE